MLFPGQTATSVVFERCQRFRFKTDNYFIYMTYSTQYFNLLYVILTQTLNSNAGKKINFLFSARLMKN